MTDSQPPKPRSRKIYVLWAIALTLLLTVGLFCWLVVVPVWQVQSLASGRDFGREAVEKRLGGPRTAVRKLFLYLRVPGRICTEKDLVFFILGNDYGEEATPGLMQILNHADPEMRWGAIYGLAQCASHWENDQVIVAAMVKRALDDSSLKVRTYAGEVISGTLLARPLLVKAIRTGPPEVRDQALWVLSGAPNDEIAAASSRGHLTRAEALKNLQYDKDPIVAQAAAEALKKIRGKAE